MNERGKAETMIEPGADLGAMIGWAARDARPKPQGDWGSPLLAKEGAPPPLHGLLPLGSEPIAAADGAGVDTMFRRPPTPPLHGRAAAGDPAPAPASPAQRALGSDAEEMTSIPWVLTFERRARPSPAPRIERPALTPQLGGVIAWGPSAPAGEMPLPAARPREAPLREMPLHEIPSPEPRAEGAARREAPLPEALPSKARAREMPLREMPLREMPLRGAPSSKEAPREAAPLAAAHEPLPERRARSAAEGSPREAVSVKGRSEAPDAAAPPPIIEGPQAAARGVMRLGARVEEIITVRAREVVRQHEEERARATSRDRGAEPRGAPEPERAPPRLDHAAIRSIAEELRAMEAEERFRSGLIR